MRGSLSNGPQLGTDADAIEQARKQNNRLAEEIAQLSQRNGPRGLLPRVLQRLISAIAAGLAPFGSTPQGNLQLQYHITASTSASTASQWPEMHGELLKMAIASGAAQDRPAEKQRQPNGKQQIAPAIPTDYVILLAPIIYDQQAVGLVEILQDRQPRGRRPAQHVLSS